MASCCSLAVFNFPCSRAVSDAGEVFRLRGVNLVGFGLRDQFRKFLTRRTCAPASGRDRSPWSAFPLFP